MHKQTNQDKTSAMCIKLLLHVSAHIWDQQLYIAYGKYYNDTMLNTMLNSFSNQKSLVSNSKCLSHHSW